MQYLIHAGIFAEKNVSSNFATHMFSAKIKVYMPYLMVRVFNDMLTNDIVSFEQLGPDV